VREHVGRQVQRAEHVVLTGMRELVREDRATELSLEELRREQDRVAERDAADRAHQRQANAVDARARGRVAMGGAEREAREHARRVTKQVRRQRPGSADEPHERVARAGLRNAEGGVDRHSRSDSTRRDVLLRPERDLGRASADTRLRTVPEPRCARASCQSGDGFAGGWLGAYIGAREELHDLNGRRDRSLETRGCRCDN
jgi:hypothetical protein